MSNAPSVIRPEISVRIAGGNVIVRELSGLDALHFFGLLAKHGGEIFRAILHTEGGKLTVNLDGLISKLVEIVTSVEEVSSFLIAKATQDDKALEKYGALQCLALLDAAMEVNLTDEHIALAKRVGGRVGRFLAAQKSDTPKSATS